MKTTIGIRIHKSQLVKWDKLYKKATKGVGRISNGYINVRIKTLSEIKGIFSSNEILTIVGSLEGDFEPDLYDKPFLIGKVTEAEFTSKLSKLCKSDIGSIVRKIETLSAFQTYILCEECYRFWNTEDFGVKNKLYSKFTNLFI